MLRRCSLALLVVPAALAIAACGGDGRPDLGPLVGVFPAADTRSASPATTISFRGLPRDRLGTITVLGTVSGTHRGRLVAHSDGRGASWVPAKPFAPNEQVRVATDLNIVNAQQGDYVFRTSPRPKAGLTDPPKPSAALARQLYAQDGDAPQGADAYRSAAPALRPPQVAPLRRSDDVARGLLLLAPEPLPGADPGAQAGAMILDDAGDPVWFAPAEEGVADLRVQQLDGGPVLTFWTGETFDGRGEGRVEVLDDTYRRIAMVRAGNGYRLDFQETQLTRRGTLLGVISNPVVRNLSDIGGPSRSRVIDSVVQEIDVKTGAVLFEWHSLNEFPLSGSYARMPRKGEAIFDYFHTDSVQEDRDGNLLISGRNCHCVMKVNRATGRRIWTLGGKRSDFKMEGQAQFAWQHDVQRADDGTLRIFDNSAAPRARADSRVLWLDVAERARTAKVARELEHPDGLSAGAGGNAQALGNGDTLVGWGTQGRVSELAADGTLRFDAQLARGTASARAYRLAWTGRPRTKPAVAAEAGAVYASWNGATDIDSWQLLAGASPDALEPVDTVARTGFETRIAFAGSPAYVAVRARDAEGTALGTSRAVQP